MEHVTKSLLLVFGVIISSLFMSYVIVNCTRSIENVTDQAVYDYEYFYNEYNDYKALNAKIDRLRQDDSERAKFKLDALLDQRADLVANYNSKSSQVNHTIFKAYDLPRKLKHESKDNEF